MAQDQTGQALAASQAPADQQQSRPWGAAVLPLQDDGGCASCGSRLSSLESGVGVDPPSYVYATGNVFPRFKTLAGEKEFAQATGRQGAAGLTDRQAPRAILTQRQNRYLARQLCWVMTIQGLDTYVLVPRDPLDLDLLVETVRPEP